MSASLVRILAGARCVGGCGLASVLRTICKPSGCALRCEWDESREGSGVWGHLGTIKIGGIVDACIYVFFFHIAASPDPVACIISTHAHDVAELHLYLAN